MRSACPYIFKFSSFGLPLNISIKELTLECETPLAFIPKIETWIWEAQQ
jgi:hypothetical protein